MSRLPFRSLAPLCGGLLAAMALLAAPPSQAQLWGRSPQTVAGADTLYDSDPSTWSATPSQLAQRCQTGRLLGGLIGGGVGYGSSRREGRSWAVPLGVLLGSQMGCNLGAGRAPVPW
ncbi:MAG: hypothetical protein VKO44_06760 [Cyanobacteriota bacterium]|jgi:hypothetical protein|nr:hypothetical protein [Cyanobacteriota bacterium]